MARVENSVEDLTQREYKYGFVTDIETDTVPPGLNEDIVRLISAKKNEPEFMLEWRLKAFRHWAKLEKSQAEPKWANVHYPPIDYQASSYYSAPKSKADGPKSLEEVDPELLKTYAKLGIPLLEQERLAGVAVDAVFDSVSVATTFKVKLAEFGRDLRFIFRSGQGASRTGAKISRFRGAVYGQLFCLAELRRV